jgi:lipoate-protein ligase A
MPDTPSLLILPHRRAPGVVQMALDSALLGWASDSPGRVAFRTYAWSRPTLSLGRAEPFPHGWDVDAIRREGVDVVRRPTGGDAVLHATELTFAVAASLPGPWGLRPRGFADLVADALASALRGSGLQAERVETVRSVASAVGARPGEHACFSRTAPGEVRVGAYKVAGIASRFTRGAALSHASVPLSEEFRDVARFRISDRIAEREALVAGARAASELLSAGLHETRIAGGLASTLAIALGAEVREAAFEDLGLEDPEDAMARRR